MGLTFPARSLQHRSGPGTWRSGAHPSSFLVDQLVLVRHTEVIVEARNHHEEGWYTDPFDRHEARWFSDGLPTKLVRDGPVESQDPPPDEPFRSEPVRVVPAHESDESDLHRADDAVSDAFDQAKATREVFGIFSAYGPH